MTEEYLPIDEKKWEETGSKFISRAGLLKAKMGLPSWKNPNVSYQFPFTVTEEGVDNGKTDVIYTSMTKFALDPIFQACGVSYKFVNGKLAFDKMAFVGKEFKAVYAKEKDNRTPEQGGKGGEFIKVQGAVAITSSAADLGI